MTEWIITIAILYDKSIRRAYLLFDASVARAKISHSRRVKTVGNVIPNYLPFEQWKTKGEMEVFEVNGMRLRVVASLWLSGYSDVYKVMKFEIRS